MPLPTLLTLEETPVGPDPFTEEWCIVGETDPELVMPNGLGPLECCVLLWCW